MPPTYQPIGKRRVSDDIVDQIETLIIRSELRVGDPLPPERELAQRLGVGRNALREAIGKLAQKGLLEVRPGSGTYVAQPSGAFISDSLHFLLRLNPGLLLDLMKARAIIETELAVMAAEKANAAQVQGMKTAVDTMQANRHDPDAYVEADLAFHTELSQAAGNQVLVLILASLRSAMRENIRYFATLADAIERNVQYHRGIYEAIAARRPDAARAAMQAHFGEFIALLQDRLDAGGAGALAAASMAESTMPGAQTTTRR
jgi:GntR family transcriptional repressor for pyruvate dehydrogenase complex